jgi:hypothetical protein
MRVPPAASIRSIASATSSTVMAMWKKPGRV